MIADGTKVHWHGPATRQGRITYTGTVLGFVPAMHSLVMWEARYAQRSQRQVFWASAKSADEARIDRYVVETAHGAPRGRSGRTRRGTSSRSHDQT
jgi:hypothetical protein